MMEAITAPFDVFAIDRGCVIVGLQQFNVHVTGKTHGEGYVHARGLAAVHRIIPGKMIEHEPGTDVQLLDPMVHCLVYVGHNVRRLDDAVVRLPETYLSHNRLHVTECTLP